MDFSLVTAETTVKCYLADTGLLSTLALSGSGRAMSEVYRQVLLGDASVSEGMLAENAVGQQLVASGHRKPKWALKGPNGTPT